MIQLYTGIHLPRLDSRNFWNFLYRTIEGHQERRLKYIRFCEHFRIKAKKHLTFQPYVRKNRSKLLMLIGQRTTELIYKSCIYIYIDYSLHLTDIDWSGKIDCLKQLNEQLVFHSYLKFKKFQFYLPFLCKLQCLLSCTNTQISYSSNAKSFIIRRLIFKKIR